MAKGEVIELLKRYISLLNSNGISVYKAYLFGSYSTNTATDASDIDLMIVSENYDETDDEVVGKIWRLTRKVSTKIEPFLIGVNKFRTSNNSPLIEQIKATGIEIALSSPGLIASEPKAQYKIEKDK